MLMKAKATDAKAIARLAVHGSICFIKSLSSIHWEEE